MADPRAYCNRYAFSMPNAKILISCSTVTEIRPRTTGLVSLPHISRVEILFLLPTYPLHTYIAIHSGFHLSCLDTHFQITRTPLTSLMISPFFNPQTKVPNCFLPRTKSAYCISSNHMIIHHHEVGDSRFGNIDSLQCAS